MMAHGQKSHHHHQGQSYVLSRHDFGAGDTSCFEIACGKCKSRAWAGNHSDMRLPSDAVHQIFRKIGWIVDPRKGTANRCPECQLHPKTSDQRINIMASVASILPRQLSGSEIRKVSDLLNDHFDEKAGAFVQGWDDKKIAETVNVPRAAVTRLREEGWGKIRVFPEIESLKSELAAIRGMLADVETKVAAAEKRRVAD